MAEPRSSTVVFDDAAPVVDDVPVYDDDPPSLDPLAVELAYRRERARRRARVERRSEARRSNVRFWISLLVLAFLSAFVILAAWHEVQTLFGV